MPEPQQDETQASKLNSIACQVHQVMILQFDIKNRLIYIEIVSSLRVERAKTTMYVRRGCKKKEYCINVWKIRVPWSSHGSVEHPAPQLGRE